MSELEDIKKKRMDELRRQQEEAGGQEQQLQQQIDAVESMVKRKLTKEALQRYGNIKAADPNRAVQVLMLLGQLIESGRADTIDDEQMKRILSMTSQKKKDINITRK